MIILVVRLLPLGDGEDYREISLSEVNYIDSWHPTNNSQRVPAFHTSSGSYLAIFNLSDLAIVYEKYGFELIAQSVLINRNRIMGLKAMNNNGSIVTFIDGTWTKVKKQI